MSKNYVFVIHLSVYCSFSNFIVQLNIKFRSKGPHFPLSAAFGTNFFFRGFLFPMSSIVTIQNLVALRLIVRATEVSEFRQFKKKHPVYIYIYIYIYQGVCHLRVQRRKGVKCLTIFLFKNVCWRRKFKHKMLDVFRRSIECTVKW